MPTKFFTTLELMEKFMKKELEKKGYEVELLYAEDSADQQVKDIENMITKGCKVPLSYQSMAKPLKTFLKKLLKQH